MAQDRAWEGVKAPFEMSSPAPPMLFIPRTAIPRSVLPVADVALKATEVWVQWVERHPDSIESISGVEHLQMNRRVLVPKRSE